MAHPAPPGLESLTASERDEEARAAWREAFSKPKAIRRGLGAPTHETLWEAVRLALDAITAADAVA